MLDFNFNDCFYIKKDFCTKLLLRDAIYIEVIIDIRGEESV